MGTTSPLPVPGEIETTIARQWRRLGHAGTWLTGPERIAIAGCARAAPAGDPPADVVLRAAGRVAHAASRLTAATVDEWEAAGLGRERYVEVVGVVSRVTAVDTFERGIGRPPRPLPSPSGGRPSRTPAVGARRRAGWVPTVGAIGATTALAAVPDEAAAQAELHAALYLPYGEMSDLGVRRGLTRPQMELLAARVSYLNHCDY